MAGPVAIFSRRFATRRLPQLHSAAAHRALPRLRSFLDAVATEAEAVGSSVHLLPLPRALELLSNAAEAASLPSGGAAAVLKRSAAVAAGSRADLASGSLQLALVRGVVRYSSATQLLAVLREISTSTEVVARQQSSLLHQPAASWRGCSMVLRFRSPRSSTLGPLCHVELLHQKMFEARVGSTQAMWTAEQHWQIRSWQRSMPSAAAG